MLLSLYTLTHKHNLSYSSCSWSWFQMISNTESFVLLQDRQITMVQLNVGQCIYVQPHCVIVFRPVTGFIEDTDQGCSHSDFLHIGRERGPQVSIGSFPSLFVTISVLDWLFKLWFNTDMLINQAAIHIDSSVNFILEIDCCSLFALGNLSPLEACRNTIINRSCVQVVSVEQHFCCFCYIWVSHLLFVQISRRKCMQPNGTAWSIWEKTIINLLRHHYFMVNGFVVICEQISAATRLCPNGTC